MALSTLFAMFAMGTGLRGAWLWYEASKIKFKPFWGEDSMGGIWDDWIHQFEELMEKQGSLNSNAALFTAISVVTAAASTLASAFGY
jgi:hypothetical protein